MRLKISLKAKTGAMINLNYNYYLSSAIYRLLKLGSNEFAAFLHNSGYTANGKRYKLFSFAIRFENFVIKNGVFNLISPNAALFVTSPLIESFIQNFIIGTFKEQKIKIGGDRQSVVFDIEQVESYPSISFNDKMNFTLLSPIVLSTKKIINGEIKQYYLRPTDTEEINRVLTNNLLNKFKLINPNDITNEDVKLEWDKSYLDKHERVTKKITINENGKFPVDVIGIQAPFTIKGNPELIKTGYECGFGEKNSMGFGLADADFTD